MLVHNYTHFINVTHISAYIITLNNYNRQTVILDIIINFFIHTYKNILRF